MHRRPSARQVAPWPSQLRPSARRARCLCRRGHLAPMLGQGKAAVAPWRLQCAWRHAVRRRCLLHQPRGRRPTPTCTPWGLRTRIGAHGRARCPPQRRRRPRSWRPFPSPAAASLLPLPRVPRPSSSTAWQPACAPRLPAPARPPAAATPTAAPPRSPAAAAAGSRSVATRRATRACAIARLAASAHGQRPLLCAQCVVLPVWTCQRA
mmetsp:Transcript_17238/g.35997  ORF Transcript_17238/g.35997 Transcript_17238/m.35997 type:complete len:208 (+) Transcript_17238:530-1153(+)